MRQRTEEMGHDDTWCTSRYGCPLSDSPPSTVNVRQFTVQPILAVILSQTVIQICSRIRLSAVLLILHSECFSYCLHWMWRLLIIRPCFFAFAMDRYLMYRPYIYSSFGRFSTLQVNLSLQRGGLHTLSTY